MRAYYWRAWRLVITWAVARQAVHDMLPMSLDTLKALTWDLICFAVPSSQIELVWKSARAGHRQFQLRQPLCEANLYSSWVKMLCSVCGRPRALRLPIQKATVRWLLAWRPTALAAHLARLLTVVATLACLRVNEVTRLQVCDLWKNDTVRKGHPALGRSRDPVLDIVAQLRTWLRVAGLAEHRSCANQRLVAKYTLFLPTRSARGGVTLATDRPCSRQQASDWIF
jgi:hypothetical protein